MQQSTDTVIISMYGTCDGVKAAHMWMHVAGNQTLVGEVPATLIYSDMAMITEDTG